MTMIPFPHRYQVTATAETRGEVMLRAVGLPDLPSLPPEAFGGPGDRWSPETLLVASIADCFVLTFRAMAPLMKLRWESLACEVEGTLDRVNRVTRFTAFRLHATLGVPPGVGQEEARKVLSRAKQQCLITNSLEAPCEVEWQVEAAATADPAAVATSG
jgi:organic hydroperoxide reductase OsmC/OhrA